jgi:hypothetical protein
MKCDEAIKVKIDFAISRKKLFYGQATKSVRWMPWHREAMKDVVSCDKLRGAAKQALIRRFPNGETRQGLCPVIVR